MFGLGMGEIILIAVLALLFVGPDKLPQTARSIGKGIRDFRKQTKDLQDTIEKDAQIGDAVRELRSALRGDPDFSPPKVKPARSLDTGAQSASAAAGAATASAATPPSTPAAPPRAPGAPATAAAPSSPPAATSAPAAAATAGLPPLRRPAGNVARGPAPTPPKDSAPTPPNDDEGAHG